MMGRYTKLLSIIAADDPFNKCHHDSPSVYSAAVLLYNVSLYDLYILLMFFKDVGNLNLEAETTNQALVCPTAISSYDKQFHHKACYGQLDDH